MSIDALSWAFNLDLPNSGVKLTLLALANYADADDCTAYPSQKAMSQKTCLSTRAIRDHLVTLEKLGVISRVPRKRENGTYTTDLFTLNVGFAPSKAIGKNSQRQILPAAKNDKIQRQISPNPAADSAYQESSLDSIITKGESSNISRPKRSAEIDLLEDVDQQIATDFISLRKAKKSPLTETAVKGIRREAERVGYTLEQALTVCCERGWSGFKAEWILREQSTGKIPISKEQEKREATERAKARLFGNNTEKDITHATA